MHGFRKLNFVIDSDHSKMVHLVVPKGYTRQEKIGDSSYNQNVFHYSDGSTLYFVYAKDTSRIFQPINFGDNMPKAAFGIPYYKGIDSAGKYWRESRKGFYKAGYTSVEEDNDWRFDSSLNYFIIRGVNASVKPVQ